MHVLDATFIKSAAEPSGWPPADLPEVAVCGRSNVGKSTLLNTVLRRKGLARVSQTPGRTRLINFFAVTLAPGKGAPPLHLRVADLPGFGYAKVSKTERATWRPQVESYFTKRDVGVLLLLDSRRAADLRDAPGGLDEEVDLCHWLLALGRQVVPVMTKADKLSKHERKPAQALVERLLHVRPVIFSSLQGEDDHDEIWRRLQRALGRGGGAALGGKEAHGGGLP